MELKVNFAYKPDGIILGLSKPARVARDLARPMTQEAYTHELVNIIYGKLKPTWCMAVVIGRHMCMVCRGVKAKETKTITNAMVFSSSDISDMQVLSFKEEFMKFVTINGT